MANWSKNDEDQWDDILDHDEESICTKMMKCFKKEKKPVQVEDQENYSEGEDETEFEIPYSKLSEKEKVERVKFLWHRAYVKSKGAAHVLAKFGELNQKIYLYGESNRL